MFLGLLLVVPFAYGGVFSWGCLYNSTASSKGLSDISANPFKLEFKLDTVTKKAFVVGNNGLSEVQYWSGDKGITFLESLTSGGMQTTVISDKGQSVHSRGTIIVNLVPSQYYGVCKVTSD